MRAHAILRDVSRPRTGPLTAGDGLEALVLTAPLKDRSPLIEQLRRLPVRLAAATDLGAFSRLVAEHQVHWALVDLSDEAQALAAVRSLRARQPLVVVAGLVDATSAVTAGQARLTGVSDLLAWPCEPADLAVFVADVRDRAAAPDRRDAAVEGPIACSSAMTACVHHARHAATAQGGVLLIGERGSGRRVLARAMHDWSGAAGPLLEIDAAAGEPVDVEARLFGRLAGLAPRASAQGLELVDRGSVLHGAAGGALFIANVSCLSSRAQARLARVLRDGQARQDDGTTCALTVRTIASDGPAAALLPQARLRHDLRDQIGGTQVEVPPLRARRADIPALAATLLRSMSAPADIGSFTFSRSALTLLTAFPWHGNGHELREAVAALVQASRGPVIGIEDVLALASLDAVGPVAPGDAGEVSLRDAKTRFERECIGRVLARHHGRMSDAARELGIQRTNLYRKVRQLNLEGSLRAARK